MTLPLITLGGMGVAVSGWRLARAAAQLGQLGVVSGTLRPIVLARGLQLGDEGGHLRRALQAFSEAAMAGRVLAQYFIEGGKAGDAPFAAVPMPSAAPSRVWVELSRSWPTSWKFFWRRRDTPESSGSICWKKFSFPICLRSTARCLPG